MTKHQTKLSIDFDVYILPALLRCSSKWAPTVSKLKSINSELETEISEDSVEWVIAQIQTLSTTESVSDIQKFEAFVAAFVNWKINREYILRRISQIPYSSVDTMPQDYQQIYERSRHVIEDFDDGFAVTLRDVDLDKSLFHLNQNLIHNCEQNQLRR